MTAHRILKLLRAKHAEDVLVDECKNGPIHTRSHVRLDAWVMKKSWANPLTIGYEIKVSRSDFLGDDKWPAYLPLCNQLFFVAPKGLIKETELAAEVGLLEVLGESRLVTRKKAPYRDLVVPEELYRYILMCRAKIGSEVDRGSAKDYWEKWLQQKAADRTIGYEVSRKIREHVQEVDKKNLLLEAKMRSYDSVRATLQKLGFNPDSEFVEDWSVQRRYNELNQLVPKQFKNGLESLANDIANMQRQIKAIEAPPAFPS